jgi:hypothetical protein
VAIEPFVIWFLSNQSEQISSGVGIGRPLLQRRAFELLGVSRVSTARSQAAPDHSTLPQADTYQVVGTLASASHDAIRPLKPNVGTLCSQVSAAVIGAERTTFGPVSLTTDRLLSLPSGMNPSRTRILHRIVHPQTKTAVPTSLVHLEVSEGL